MRANLLERTRGVRLEDEIAHRGIKLRRQRSELIGPCPRCGGTDRLMTSPARAAAAQARLALNAGDVFRARAQTRAILFAEGIFDLHEAVDVLQADAEAIGLLDEIGQDALQAIMSQAFGSVRWRF